jgi:hypothetical protein
MKIPKAKIIEMLIKAHMKGQLDAGCKEPSYSNALADCLKILEGK